MPGGKRDSSKTRVQPVFGQLLSRCQDGSDWLPSLLRLTTPQDHLSAGLVASPGTLLSGADTCFERRFPPPERFLRWLIEHPDAMAWPKQGPMEHVFGARTQRMREALFGRNGLSAQAEAQDAALSQMARYGASKSRRRWWTFEGFTHVDCCLETKNLLLFIEGKRTDRVSRATAWYPQRNQLARNLEVAKEHAHGREYALLLIAEEEPQPEELDLPPGLPHLEDGERDGMLSHFLGWITWRAVCGATGTDYDALPDSTDGIGGPTG
jgi:hypothetical protein